MSSTLVCRFSKWTPLLTSSLCWLAGKLFSRTAEYLRYLRIAESSLTHQTARIEVNRGVQVLTSWLHTISSLKNICAHHARLWNRVFGVSPKRVKILKDHFHQNDRFYAQAVAIKVLLNNIAGESLWANKLKDLLDKYPEVPQKHMGFIENWEQTDLWSRPPPKKHEQRTCVRAE